MTERHPLMELVCPAGSLPALKAAVDEGADSVYIGFRDGTNARHFPGLNFDARETERALRYAHDRGAKVFLAINTYPRPAQWQRWCAAVDLGAALGIDAMILADPGLMQYAVARHPGMRLHLSVQGSATNHRAIAFHARHAGIQRVVLPRVLSLTQVRQLIQKTNVEVEVFGFGSLCVMVEGRCMLSSHVTGRSPNSNGVCSPADAVRWEEGPGERRVRLNGVMVDTFAAGEQAGYPVICKGRYRVDGHTFYALEEPISLNVLDILPQLVDAGVAAIKVEGRQRSPAYVAQVTRVMRAALDACLADPRTYAPREDWMAQLDRLGEGACHTLGAYHRPWQ